MSDPDDEKADPQVGPDKPPRPQGGPEFVDADDERPPGSVRREDQPGAADPGDPGDPGDPAGTDATDRPGSVS